jgi:hypothetical protein
MCRVGPCADPSSHAPGAAIDGPVGPTRPGGALPKRIYPDVGARPAQSRRALLAKVVGVAAFATGCSGTPVADARRAEPTLAPKPAAEQEPAPVPAIAPGAETVVAAPSLHRVAAPVQPMRLGVGGLTQPAYASNPTRIIYYDQPAPGQGGTFSIGTATAEPRRERPDWGYVDGDASLMTVPRPAQRDSLVTHLPSGRQWTLPTTSTPIFSRDGGMVAFTASAAGAPGGPSTGAGLAGWSTARWGMTTLAIGSADGSDLRRVQLPLNGSAIAWVPSADGTPNGRLLLSGRRNESDDPSYWTFDPSDASLTELARGKRLIGALASTDGTWLAHVTMWSGTENDGLWVTRTDGTARRRVAMIGGYRWTDDNRLVVIPHRQSWRDSHVVWEVDPTNGDVRRLTDPATTSFAIANYDWDLSPDGSELVYVSTYDKAMWRLDLGTPSRGRGVPAPTPPPPPAPSEAVNGQPYRLPFAEPPGPSTWYIGQWYGVTTGGYRGRNSTYSQGQGIHFGIDFACPCGTEVVAVGSGRVIAVDGDFGSPPHNCVILLDDGNIAMYGHLVERTRHVKVGDRVVPGQVVGNTGDSIAPYTCNRNPHLHLEIRKQGRAVATNPVPYFEANWDDMGLGTWPGPRFERNLDDPKAHQFLDDQPDIRFGGPIITNLARPWPP